MGKTVLLADDSVTIRNIVELTFADSDIRVESVGSGHEALERLAVLRPDLVLADVVMPEPSGYDLCRQVKDSAHPVPVLLLAGTFEPFDAERARRCGADGHLIKPFEASALIARVRRLLEPQPVAQSPLAEAPSAPALGDTQEVEQALDEMALAPNGDVAEPGPAGQAEPLAADARAFDPGPGEPTPAELDALARALVGRLSDDLLREVVREVAREVVPQVAERLVRERIRQLETEDPD